MTSSRFRVAGAALAIVASAGCATSPATRLVEVSSGQYEVTERSGFFMTASPAELHYRAVQQALRYCAPRGGKLSIVDSRIAEAEGTDFASSTVLFRCG